MYTLSGQYIQAPSPPFCWQRIHIKEKRINRPRYKNMYTSSTRYTRPHTQPAIPPGHYYTQVVGRFFLRHEPFHLALYYTQARRLYFLRCENQPHTAVILRPKREDRTVPLNIELQSPADRRTHAGLQQKYASAPIIGCFSFS